MQEIAYYDDASDHWFDSIEDACEFYDELFLEDFIFKVTEVPEFLYEGKIYEISDDDANGAAFAALQFINENVEELAPEDESFSETLPFDKTEEFVALIKTWMQSVCTTIVPDYDKKVPFKEIYNKKELA